MSEFRLCDHNFMLCKEFYGKHDNKYRCKKCLIAYDELMKGDQNKPNFTQEQKDFICWQIGEWYLMMKPLLEGKQHNLGFMKEKLKLMVCDESTHMFDGL